MNLKVPIYFSTGLTEKANHYYKLFITWTNQKIRKTFVQRNMFEFKHIKAFDRTFADNPGPMVRLWQCSFSTSGLPVGLWARLLVKDLVLVAPLGKVCSVPCPPCRLYLLHLGCCTLANPCRSSENGQEMRRTW